MQLGIVYGLFYIVKGRKLNINSCNLESIDFLTLSTVSCIDFGLPLICDKLQMAGAIKSKEVNGCNT